MDHNLLCSALLLLYNYCAAGKERVTNEEEGRQLLLPIQGQQRLTGCRQETAGGYWHSHARSQQMNMIKKKSANNELTPCVSMEDR